MNSLEIEAFMAITETRNLSKAADRLFISQSTISSRLTGLEEEIGEKLVIRRPGVKGISLTPKGGEFLTLASRYLEVEKDIKIWKENVSRYDLKVSAPHSINSYLFTGLYHRLLGNSQLRLTISTHWNNTIYNLMDQYLLDVGFVSRPFPSRNLVTVPIFYEPMVFVSDRRYSSYPVLLDVSDLAAENEIYLDWGYEYEIWHNQNWSPVVKPRVCVDTPTLIEFFLQSEQAWAAVPLCVAKMINTNETIAISALKPQLPQRTIYVVTQREVNPSGAKAVRILIDETKQYAATLDCVCLPDGNGTSQHNVN